jgi:hypothetical protein
MRGFDVPADWYLTDSYPVLAWEDAGPFFTVTVAETTASVTAEETLAVAVNVTNYGARGTQPVTLTDTDFAGSRQDAVRVTLDPGESVSVTLTWTPRLADGGVTGTISVDSANDAAALNVTVAEATTPSPTPTPEPDRDPEPTPEPDPTATPTPEPDPTAPPEPDRDPEPTPEPDPTATPTPEPDPTPTPEPDRDPEPTPEPDPTPTATPGPTTTTQQPTSDPSTTPQTTAVDAPGFGLLVAVLAVGLAVLLGLRLRN